MGASRHSSACAVVQRDLPLRRYAGIGFAEYGHVPVRDTGYSLPSFGNGGSMELMAVPKKKVSLHRRGIRNGPKALKPQPVIIRCRSCGRVKLPHFYRCRGDRGNSNEQNQ